MESQTDHGTLNEREPHHTRVGPGHQTVAEGDQGEPHHEKKSVFTKVKARARKMKDSLTGHGPGLDEEGDEDDQEKFEDPQIHDSPTARNEDLPTSVAGRETFDRTKPQENDRELGADHRQSKQSSSYTDKISYPTTGIADKAVSDKNVEASTLGYGDKDNTTGVHDHEGVGGRPSSDQSSYTQKISFATSAIADRAISAKNVVALKLGYGGKDNEVPGTGTFGTANQQQQQRGVEGNNQEKGGGGVADRAISAKNLVASKLGYGEKDNTTGGHEVPGTGTHSTANQQQQQRGVEGNNQEKGGGGGIADRAISAKNLVASKLGYGEKDNTPGGHEVPGTGTHSSANQQQQQRGVEGNNQEKGGGGSVKGYFAEKLKPGEEDKALSEVITETLNKRKPKQQQKQEAAPRPVGEVISDAMHKRNDYPDGEVNNRPMGKVTESDEVARRLGDTKDDQAPGNKGMLDKIKGAAGSWFGQGDQSPGSQPGPARDDTGHTNN